MKVDVSTELPCSVEKAWNEVQKSSLLTHVTWPLAKLVSVNAPFPERWTQGSTISCRPYLLGFIPIGVRTLHFDAVDHDNHEIRTREHDPLVRRWDHRISIRARGEDRAIYRDEIELDAGLLTLPVWAWTSWFYRHRQRRWRALARKL